MIRPHSEGWEVGVSVLTLSSLRETRYWTRVSPQDPVEEYGKMAAMVQAFGPEDPLPDLLCTNEPGMSEGFGPACYLGMALRVPCFGVTPRGPAEGPLPRNRGESHREGDLSKICPHPGRQLYGDVGWGLGLPEVESWVYKMTTGSEIPLPLFNLVKRGWAF